MTQNLPCRRYNNGSIYEQVGRNHLNPIGRGKTTGLGGDGSSIRQLSEKGAYRTQASSQDFSPSSPFTLEDVFRPKQHTIGPGFSRQAPFSFPALQEQRHMNLSPSVKSGCASTLHPVSLPRLLPESGQSSNRFLPSASQSGLINASQLTVDLGAAPSSSSSQPLSSFDNMHETFPSRAHVNSSRSFLPSLPPAEAHTDLPHLAHHDLSGCHDESSMDASTSSISYSGSIPGASSAPNRIYPPARSAELEKRTEMPPKLFGRNLSRRDAGSPCLKYGPKDPSLTSKAPVRKLEKVQLSASSPKLDSLSSSEVLQFHSTALETMLDHPNDADRSSPISKEDICVESPRKKLLMPLTSIVFSPASEVHHSPPQNDLSVGLPQAPGELQFYECKPNRPGRRASYAIASIIGSPKLESAVKFTSNFPNIHYINRITKEEIPGILCSGCNFLYLAVNPPPSWALAKIKDKKDEAAPLCEKVKPKPAFSAVVFSPKNSKKR